MPWQLRFSRVKRFFTGHGEDEGVGDPSRSRVMPPGQEWLWAVVVLLTAQAVAIFVLGSWPGWVRSTDGDLRDRAAEYSLFREGIYPNAHLESHPQPHETRYTVYPPYAFPLFAMFFEPGGMLQGRFLIQSLSLASLVAMGMFAFRTLAPYGAPVAMIGATAGSAIAGNYTALFCGQLSVICTGLIVAQLVLLKRDRPLAAGACWALAMIKPQIALPFGLLFLGQGRLRGLVLAATLLLGLSLAACLWTGVPPGVVLHHWYKGMSLRFLEDGAGVGPGSLARSFGLDHRSVQVAVLLLLAVVIVPVARLLGRRGQAADRALAGACGVAGMLGFYHRHYDNIMLFPTLLATIEVAATSRRPAAMIAAVSLLLSLIVHRRFLDELPFHEWMLAAVWVVAGFTSLSLAAGPRWRAGGKHPDAA